MLCTFSELKRVSDECYYENFGLGGKIRNGLLGLGATAAIGAGGYLYGGSSIGRDANAIPTPSTGFLQEGRMESAGIDVNAFKNTRKSLSDEVKDYNKEVAKFKKKPSFGGAFKVSKEGWDTLGPGMQAHQPNYQKGLDFINNEEKEKEAKKQLYKQAWENTKNTVRDAVNYFFN